MAACSDAARLAGPAGSSGSRPAWRVATAVFSPEKEKWQKQALVSAYWWVPPTSEKGEATMALAKMSSEDLAFPVYENIKALKPGDKLLVFVTETAGPAGKRART